MMYSVLFPYVQKLWPFMFDKSLRVRKMFLQMLIKLHNIKSFDFTHFFVLDDFLLMALFFFFTNPTNSINRLYVKFLYPIFWQEVSVLIRCHS